MVLVRVGPLPDDALSAAAQFYAEVLPQIAPGDETTLTLIFRLTNTNARWQPGFWSTVQRPGL